MSDHDEELTSALQDYYRAVAQQPAPDVTERVMMSADRRTVRIRRWTAIGGGALAAAAVGAVVAVAFVNHNQASPGAPAHSATPGPTVTAAPPSPSPSVTPSMPQSPPFVGGAACARIRAHRRDRYQLVRVVGARLRRADVLIGVLHTDRAHHRRRIPLHLDPRAAGGTRPERAAGAAAALRRRRPTAGWWMPADSLGDARWRAALDGHWRQHARHRPRGVGGFGVRDRLPWARLLDRDSRRPGTTAGWSCPPRRGRAALSHLNVNGSHVWAADRVAGRRTPDSIMAPPSTAARASAGTPSARARWGSPISTQIDSSTLWATCATGTQAAAYRSDRRRQLVHAAAPPQSEPAQLRDHRRGVADDGGDRRAG